MIAARLLDLLLVLVLCVYLGEGWRNGIVRSVSAILGVAAGGVAAFFAMPIVAAAIPSPEWRLTVSVALGVLLLIGGHLLGVAIGRSIEGRRPDDRRRSTDLTTAERLLGAVANVVASALVITLVAGSVAQLGVPVLSQAVNRSVVIGTIDRITPGPVAEGLARVRSAIFEQGLPTIDDALGGIAASQDPPDVDTASDPLAAAARSVARINGTAFACGQNQTGSGFVVAPERVVTNAHVVAGVVQPIVELPDGQTLDARVVWFDPEGDIAILAVDGLDAAPLELADPAIGDDAVVDGYPHGGPFTSKPAKVLAISNERVADIYGDGWSTREVATVAAEVQPGNSGGPLITLDGRVAGVVFARNAEHANLGYATTVGQLSELFAGAGELTAPVEPGSCVAG
ncbi:MarP family serine protease [Protaetiibacter sp. SSC-01]|uniref:MarP family serine protease n=1 Tax=Protaetiibacter sp. SSC-01 TaxID=2759943 RepID=UPI001656D60F|nr:MarP family serine protease [Protaetiibacter sp. SSC-01]QNO36636.1 MarP family serine protease [Protaetiibacter sp. SSC-01]